MSQTADLAEEAATLIGDVGRCSQTARRYRALAASVAEPAFDRALVLGSHVRRQLRSDEKSPQALQTTIAELRRLVEDCETAIGEVRASALYRDALASFQAGATGRVAALALDLFTDVSPEPSPGTVFWPVPIAGGRPGVHFLPPAECATRIAAASTEGVPAASPPSHLGSDDQIGAVALSDEHDPSESPFALVFAGPTLPGPLCRLTGTSTLLFYAARLVGPFVVRAAPTPTDEWWAVRANAYPGYVDELRNQLASAGITLEVAIAD